MYKVIVQLNNSNKKPISLSLIKTWPLCQQHDASSPPPWSRRVGKQIKWNPQSNRNGPVSNYHRVKLAPGPYFNIQFRVTTTTTAAAASTTATPVRG